MYFFYVGKGERRLCVKAFPFVGWSLIQNIYIAIFHFRDHRLRITHATIFGVMSWNVVECRGSIWICVDVSSLHALCLTRND